MSEPTDTLERRLNRLRHEVDFPPTPDLATSVRAEIETAIERRHAGPSRALTHHPRWQPRWQRPWTLAGIAATLAIVVAVLAVPASRAVVADWLDLPDLPGVRFEVIDDTPQRTATAPSAVGMTLLLGERVTLEDAAAAAPFAIRLPQGGGLGAPDEVYVRSVQGSSLVSLLYLPRPGLPEIGETGVGAMLMQFQAGREIELVVKGVAGIESVTSVSVGGAQGYWVEDGQLYIAPDPTGYLPVYDSAPRPSGNVLLWAEGGVTYRLETALDREAAIALATSLSPPAATPTGSGLWCARVRLCSA